LKDSRTQNDPRKAGDYNYVDSAYGNRVFTPQTPDPWSPRPSGLTSENAGALRADSRVVFFCVIFLALHEGLQFVPFVGGLFALLPVTSYRDALSQFIWYAAMTAPLVLLIRKFLVADIQAAGRLKKRGRLLLGRVFLCVIVGNIAVNRLLTALEEYLPSLGNVNEKAINAMLGSGAIFAIPTVCVLAPILEELIFRVGLYGLLRGRAGSSRSRVVFAAAVTTLAFALYHVWVYAVAYKEPLYFLYALQYLCIPIGLVALYEKSGSITLPIVFHAMWNTLSVVITLRSGS
jgi:membrane protease YdiL (CAAX protease family)